ncbi:hypothetical protein CP533_0238 [Ophiocordyceps camponoti-saundersi (nom. inval.)]|nr:hypothetical protein CP533_0238 [Ophiocordyceps camponoti-saundersi (nom. inval.)]
MASTKPTVSINGGTIIGRHQPASADYGRAMDVFYDIPYGQAAARFQRATSFPPVSPGQTMRAEEDRGPGQPQILQDYDCDDRREGELRLHVFRACRCSSSSSSASCDSPLPVVVYVHGGAFNFGSPHQDRDLVAWASWSDKPIVVFALEYRLGVLGFGGAGGTENIGLWDQRLAMEWVRDWGASFGGRVGGDVTLMGFSAGAHSIGHHLLSPIPLPLPISKAILESGGPTARSVLSPKHERPIRHLASLRRYASGKKLDSIPLPDLLSAASSVWADEEKGLTWPFQPVVDVDAGPQSLIPDLPLRLLSNLGADGKGKANHEKKLSLLTGFCSNEASSFISSQADLASFFRQLVPKLNLDELQGLYPDTLPLRAQRAYADYAYVAPVLQMADALSKTGSRVLVYEYGATPSSHGDHVPISSRDPLFIRRKPGLRAVADAMVSRWTAFASDDGDSLVEGADDDQVGWPVFDIDSNPRILVFGAGNDEADGGLRHVIPVAVREFTASEIGRFRFWWRNVHLGQGMAC